MDPEGISIASMQWATGRGEIGGAAGESEGC